MGKQIITASTDTTSGLGYFLTELWAKIKATFYTKTETDTKLGVKASTSSLTDGSVTKVGTATKGSSTMPIYLSGGTPTTCSTYAGGTSVTLNGTSKASTTASFYAPTTAGTSNYILTSNGSGAPSWKNSIDVNVASFISLELNKSGSTSAGHGGYIDFHYNASTEDYTSRIIDWNNRLAVMGKLLIQDGGVKYLGAGNDYTLTNTDNICFIRSDSKNNITVPAGSGITNRHLYALSMIAGSTLTYHTYRISDFTIADVSLIMKPGKVYHLIAYDTNTWYLMNDIDNDHNSKEIRVVTDTTLADFYVTTIALGSGSSNSIILTLPKSQAVQDRELMIYNPNTGTAPKIKYQVPAGAEAYRIIALESFCCIKFIALNNYWYYMAIN